MRVAGIDNPTIVNAASRVMPFRTNESKARALALMSMAAMPSKLKRMADVPNFLGAFFFGKARQRFHFHNLKLAIAFSHSAGGPRPASEAVRPVPR